MKKSIIYGIALGAIMLTSCKKTYRCECTSDFTIAGQTTTFTNSTDEFEAKKGKANDACDSFKEDQTAQGATNVNCTLIKS